MLTAQQEYDLDVLEHLLATQDSLPSEVRDNLVSQVMEWHAENPIDVPHMYTLVRQICLTTQ